MNYDQAKEYSFLVPWKTSECFSGKDCWCRIVLPVEPILYNHPESPDIEHEYVIVDAGALDEETAEYMVKLHNEHYERVKQSCKDALKETIDSLINLDENQVENLKQEWNKLNVGLQTFLRKEID